LFEFTQRAGHWLSRLDRNSSGIRDGEKFRKVERYKFNGSEYAGALAP
jgi:hypothetical protein